MVWGQTARLPTRQRLIRLGMEGVRQFRAEDSIGGGVTVITASRRLTELADVRREFQEHGREAPEMNGGHRARRPMPEGFSFGASLTACLVQI